jgi:hypothetical protein
MRSQLLLGTVVLLLLSGGAEAAFGQMKVTTDFADDIVATFLKSSKKSYSLRTPHPHTRAVFFLPGGILDARLEQVLPRSRTSR